MHRLGDEHHAYAWDRDADPAVTIAPGDTVELVIREASDGQLSPASSDHDVGTLDSSRANPLTGPVAVDGATPGDTLVVHVEDVAIDTWGWTAVIPGFGLLDDDFPEPHLTISRTLAGHIAFGDAGLELPRRPFIGTIGVAPATDEPQPTIPPLATGGNLDCRDVRPGALLRLPVAVDGALLSVGDTHAVQGDGEVCGTAVESPATVRLRVEVESGSGSESGVAAPQLTIPSDTSPRGRCHATMGVGPDLHEAARSATRAMVEWLASHHGLAPVEAYMLCSVIADLRIREIVNEPNWVVSLDLPLDVLR